MVQGAPFFPVQVQIALGLASSGEVQTDVRLHFFFDSAEVIEQASPQELFWALHFDFFECPEERYSASVVFLAVPSHYFLLAEELPVFREQLLAVK